MNQHICFLLKLKAHEAKYVSIMTISYRKAATEDYDFLKKLDSESMYDVVVATYGVWDATAFDKYFSVGNVQIIEEDSVPIGMMRLRKETNRIFLEDLQIIPDKQMCGYGTQILQSIIEDAKSNKLELSLRVLKKNQASNLYHRLGFSVIAESVTHLIMHWSPGSAI